MVKWALAGLLLLAVIAVPAAAPAFADLPIKQWEPGIALKNIACQDGLHLMVSAAGRPACVTEQTGKVMEGRGWDFFYGPNSPLYKATIIRSTIPVLEEVHYRAWYDVNFPPTAQQVGLEDKITPFGIGSFVIGALPPRAISAVYSDEDPDWIDTTIKPTITNIGQGLDPSDEAFWPQYTMEFKYATSGYHPFELPYNYTYVVPGEGGDYGNPIHQCPPEQCEGQHLEIQTSSFVTLLNKEADFILQATDPADGISPRHYNVYRMELPFDNTKPMQVMLEFMVSMPLNHEPFTNYHIGMIYPRVHDTGDAMYLHMLAQRNLVAFDPVLGSGKFDQAWYARLGYHVNDTVGSGEKAPRVVQNGLIWSEGQTGPPIEVIKRSHPGPEGPIDGVHWSRYTYFADKLQESFPGGDYEQILQDSNIKQEWIDGFLDAMPYLR